MIKIFPEQYNAKMSMMSGVTKMRGEWYGVLQPNRLLGELLFPVCIDHVFLDVWHDRGMCLETRRSVPSLNTSRERLTLYSMENSPATATISA